jgi:general secretion pathway protein N
MIKGLAVACLIASAVPAAAQQPPPEADSGVLPPLSQLSETRDRPLFSPMRRPPQMAPAPAPVAVPTVALAPAPPPPEKPPFTLVGAIVGGAQRVAVLQDAGTGALATAREGDVRGAWTIDEIGRRAIVVSMAERRVRLDLPAPSGVASQPASAAPPPTEDSLSAQATPAPAHRTEKAH